MSAGVGARLPVERDCWRSGLARSGSLPPQSLTGGTFEDAPAGEIRENHASSRGAYGAPRVHAALRRGGHTVNRKRVERIMRESDIRGVTRRRCRHLTKQDTKAAPAPDLVGRDFTAKRPGTKLVGDITYLVRREALCRIPYAVGRNLEERS
ncbi:IS3 family transposase [Streptomyces sp. NBC_01549]|uniref:IS3 family transposase n=1 Tax=Streptomyces sp. NBC_01549 TaxID=2975874 RepID=UPI00224C947D|nr:IS3 family transposase [Streptomyces sp. NBC_01549]MCX4593227.1 IS3 family transposase [Streptomyces sp. NBC_01549]